MFDPEAGNNPRSAQLRFIMHVPVEGMATLQSLQLKKYQPAIEHCKAMLEELGQPETIYDILVRGYYMRRLGRAEKNNAVANFVISGEFCTSRPVSGEDLGVIDEANKLIYNRLKEAGHPQKPELHGPAFAELALITIEPMTPNPDFPLAA